MDKNILVVSHERSGTHFLINSIAYNMGFDPNPINFPITHTRPRDNDSYKDLLNNFVAEESQKRPDKIYKTHHDVRFFADCWEELVDNFHIIYIERCFLDVMTSMHFYFNKNPHAFPQTSSVKELIYSVPYEHNFDYAYSYTDHKNFISRWVAHTLGWGWSHDVYSVKYATLFNDFETQIGYVLDSIGKDRPEKYYRPSLSDPCVSPRKGGQDDHINHISKEDIKIITEDMQDILSDSLF